MHKNKHDDAYACMPRTLFMSYTLAWQDYTSLHVQAYLLTDGSDFEKKKRNISFLFLEHSFTNELYF